MSRGRSWQCRATLLWVIPVHAADDVTELLVQVKKKLEQSQRQMEQSHRQLEQSQRQLEQSQREVKALKQQVEVLTKRVEQTLVAPARDVAPAPDAKDAVVMRNVDALPPVPKKSPSISVRSVANSLGVRVSMLKRDWRAWSRVSPCLRAAAVPSSGIPGKLTESP